MGGGYYGWGGPVAAGVIGGLALGALAGSAYAYGPAYYGGCYWQNRPVYDSLGQFCRLRARPGLLLIRPVALERGVDF